jgi:hypothetical protein
MSFKLPTTDQLREIGENLGMDLSPDYADSVIRYLTPFAAGYRELLALPDDVPPVKYPRAGYYRPQGEENRYGAWAAKFSIKGAPGGKLAGKKVAIKDTYAVAGVPLTNGASVLEGYIPEFDATVVTRLLDAGAEIVGKSTCEYFSFSGGAATSTGAQPARHGAQRRRLVHRLGRAGRGRRGFSRDRRRPGRLGPHPGLPLWRGRHETHLGPRSLYGHHGHGPDHRPRRAAHREGRR